MSPIFFPQSFNYGFRSIGGSLEFVQVHNINTDTVPGTGTYLIIAFDQNRAFIVSIKSVKHISNLFS